MTEPNWHFTLSDGTTTLSFLCSDPSGREQSLRHWRRDPLDKSAMKLGSGRTRYDDLVPPWYAIAQDDWAGGRGSIDLVDDPSRFWHSGDVQSWVPKRLVLGPLKHIETIFAPDEAGYGWTTYDGWRQVPRDDDRLAQSFQVTAQSVLYGVRFRVQNTEAYTAYLNVQVFGFTDGEPDFAKVLASGVTTVLPSASESIATIIFYQQVTLEASTDYAMVFFNAAVTGNGLQVRYNTTSTYTPGSLWYYDQSFQEWTQLANYDAPMSLVAAGATARFWWYKGLLYCTTVGVGGQSVLYRRGHHGVAAAGAYNTITLASAVGTVGATVRLVEGTGAGQWREITAVNGAVCTVDSDWDVTPDTTTVYAVTAGWQQITTVSGYVKDILVVDGVAYLARGSETVIRRFQWTNAGGDQSADDGTNKADWLVEFRDENNDPAIWRALGNEISPAAIVAWGTDLTFGTATRVGSADSRITALEVYDDHLYICKEDGLYAIQEDIVRRVPVDFTALRAPDNGKAMAPWNLYLIWPLQQGLERMYGTQVDDFGPNTGRGLPSELQGVVTAILPMPGLLVVGLDAGPEGYSSVLAYNNLGWHVISISDQIDRPVTSVFYETLGDGNGRLYWNEGSSICYATWSGAMFDRSLDAEMDYAEVGTIIFSWLGSDLQDVDKLWRRVTIVKEQTADSTPAPYVTLDYRMDDESASWIDAELVSTSDTMDVFKFPYDAQGSPCDGVVARRLQLRLELVRGGTSGAYTTPEIKAITVDAVGRIRTSFAYRTHIQVDTLAVSMLGTTQPRDPDAVLSTMDAWAASAQPLTLGHVLPEFDQREVFLEPVEATLSEYMGDGKLRVTRVLSISLVELT